ncbi:MAG: sugar transferase [Acidobacteria bacterium]|nr:sugar transferase [Acidobacteriota bacterium]
MTEYVENAVPAAKPRTSSQVASTPPSRHLVSATVAAWAGLDVVTAFIAAFLALRVRQTAFQSPHLTHELVLAGSLSSFLIYVAWFSICLIFFTRSYNLYGPIESRSGINEQRLTVQATLTAGLIVCGTLYITHGEGVSRLVILLMVAITGSLLCARRALWRSMVYARYREGVVTQNVLIIGSGRVAHALRNHLESLRHLGFRFKGFIALTPEEAASSDPDMIGDLENCLSLARGLFVDEIFISVPTDKRKVIQLVEEAREYDIDVRVVPDLYDGLAWNASVEYVGQFPTIPLHRRNFPVGSFMLKRVLDTTVSLLLLILLAPVLVLISLLIALDSKGPVLYKAKRIGRKGRVFSCFKFRTMVPDADARKHEVAHLNERDGILFKAVNDPRITRVGRYLRKYSLDEIPQFWNVIRGDMSLVGPRPPMASEVEKYDLSHLRRLDVLPGITGLWQVEARQDPSFDSYISLDTAYVENWTLWLDLKILVRTISVVLGGTGA